MSTAVFAFTTVLMFLLLYVAYPAYCRRSARPDANSLLPGDELVPRATTGYTIAIDIDAPAQLVWPWLVQMGQGRAGFYTHTWVETLFGARIRNARTIVADWQQLVPGDRIRLTPDPYLGQPGQHLVVAQLVPDRALVLSQTLPNNSFGTWAFALRDEPGRTRLVFRRRGTKASLFDRLMLPGYYFMDRGMLAGIKRRVEPAQSSKLLTFIQRHPALAYFASTFAISWGGILAIVGPTNILAPPDVFLRMQWVPALVLGPSVSGVLLTAIVDGRRGLREYRARLSRWRVPGYWYAIALLLAPFYNLLTCLAASAWSPAFTPGVLATDDPASYLISGIIVALSAGVFEELGWTGFATPTLRRRCSAFTTGLVIGLLWGAWHVLPKLLGARAFDSVPFMPVELVAAVVGLTGYRILMVWVYERTQSLPVGIAMHTGLTASMMLVQPLVRGASLTAIGVVQAIIPWLIVASVVAYRHQRHRRTLRKAPRVFTPGTSNGEVVLR